MAWRLTANGRMVMVASGAFVCLAVAPAVGVNAAASSTGGARLSMTVTAPQSIADGATVTYTIALANTGSAAALAVTVDTRLGGAARSMVSDGTAASPNSFVGTPLVTVEKLGTGHYRWTYPGVTAGAVDTVRFAAVVSLPPGTAGAPAAAVTNSVSVSGLVPQTTTTVVNPAPARPGIGAGGGVATTTPQTGTSPDVGAAGLLLLAGTGLILAGVLGSGDERRIDT